MAMPLWVQQRTHIHAAAIDNQHLFYFLPLRVSSVSFAQLTYQVHENERETRGDPRLDVIVGRSKPTAYSSLGRTELPVDIILWLLTSLYKGH